MVEMCQSSIKNQRDFFDGIERPRKTEDQEASAGNLHQFEIPVETEDSESTIIAGFV